MSLPTPYKITEQDIKAANTYMPIWKKSQLAKIMAQACVENVKVAMKNDDGTVTAVPDILIRNPLHEQQFAMGVLLEEYFKKPFDPVHAEDGKPIKYLMSGDDIDRYAHIENQIERLKRNKEVADKCYDLLDDYHDFRKMLSTEIFSALTIGNDVVGRLSKVMEQGTDPEKLQAQLKVYKELTDELQKKQAEKAAKPTKKANGNK